jgi:hypothetical protein
MQLPLSVIKRNITPQDFAALYQQEPTQEVGTFFKDEWLKPYVDETPKFLLVYGGSDYAVTSDGGDYTVHVVIGIDHKERMFLLDLWRKQADPREWVEAYCDLVLKWRPSFWAEEKTQITSGIGPFIDADRSSARRGSSGSSFRREATRRRGQRRSAAGWRSLAFMSPQTHRGFLTCAPSYWRSQLADMTTRWTPWVSADS